MRKLIADLIISLDGYYTSLENQIDWFDFDDEEWGWSGEILRRVDAVLYGRVTYEEFRQFWGTSESQRPGIDQYTRERLNDLPKIVFSKSLTDAQWKPASLIREDPGTAVAKLKNEPGKDIAVVGSGTLVASLLQAGMIDDFYIRIRPLILGAGRPLFLDSRARHPLKLVGAKTFKSGLMGLHYVPAPADVSG